MVSVPARRTQVAFAATQGISQRRACTLVKVGRSALRYRSLQAGKDAPVLAAMRELSAQYPRAACPGEGRGLQAYPDFFGSGRP